MDVYVARQPIFDIEKRVVAYELLYRSGMDGGYDVTMDPNQATVSVMADSILHVGLSKLTGGKKAFINFTHHLMVENLMTFFNPDELTVEILEDVVVDDALIEACAKLKKQGYTIALDDYTGDERFDAVMPYVDILKVDFMILKSQGRKWVADKYKHLPLKLLAEKVETVDDFNEAIFLGYELFQGYFFEKPVVYHAKTMPMNSHRYFEVIKEVISPEASFEKMENIIKTDVTLSYQLLRLINSPGFAVREHVTSVKQALTLLGLEEIKKWITLIMLRDYKGVQDLELIRNSLVRGIMAEKLCKHFNLVTRQNEVFLLGLFSMIDTIMERPLYDILEQLPIEEDIKEAMLGVDNGFHHILKCLVFYERGRFPEVEKTASRVGLDLKTINSYYIESIKESDTLLALD